MKTLRECLPYECHSWSNDRFHRYLDMKVVREVQLGEEGWRSWPGGHTNVMNWYVLENGMAVGWNESPSRGWSFPVASKKQVLKVFPS